MTAIGSTTGRRYVLGWSNAEKIAALEKDARRQEASLADLAGRTENEINFLAFPAVTDAMAIFGAGYGFDNLATATWLHDRTVFYWGDIDTHGLAILDQLRGHLPHAVSFLMDEPTLLAHRRLWGAESQPETARLTRLNAAESALYDRLRRNHWGERVRLEQERIGFDFLRDRLQGL